MNLVQKPNHFGFLDQKLLNKTQNVHWKNTNDYDCFPLFVYTTLQTMHLPRKI